jgi:hypothetical protein
MMNKEKAILEVVREMRGYQQYYFHSRSPVALSKAKTAEKKVDSLLAEYFLENEPEIAPSFS